MIQISQLNQNIYSLKAIGYSDLDFHGNVYRNDEGASYNSYLIIDDEITLIDTLDEHLKDEFLRSIKRIIGDKKIDNLIVNHTEPDHSGSFESIMAEYKEIKCYCSNKAEKPMKNMYFGDYEYTTVNTGDKINTGKYNFTFILTPFVHWPDNMVTYLEEEKILFSNDAFGSLVSNNKVYDDEYELYELLELSKEYYANIVMPCSKFVIKTLDEILAMNLDIKLICPSHGIVWRSHINDIINHYYKWAKFENVKNKVVIIFDTIWGNTEIITNEIASRLCDYNIEVRVFKAGQHRPSLIMKEVLEASVILMGTSNFNNTMTPPIADILERLYALKPQNKTGMVYGSYGWAKMHLKRVSERMSDAGITLLEEEVYSMYKPDDATMEYANNVAKKINDILNN